MSTSTTEAPRVSRRERIKAQREAMNAEREAAAQAQSDQTSSENKLGAWVRMTAWLSFRSRRIRRWFAKHRKVVYAIAFTAFLLLATITGGFSLFAAFGPVVTATMVGAYSQVLTLLALLGVIFVLARDDGDSTLSEVQSVVGDALEDAKEAAGQS